ncbi:sugar kinase [Histidinibacterium lentulum]|uniref:Sugar kinase n=1 Tax=Histidinibacterium lentulum TaxID=2480588 RepID=A0A3N2QRE0_9RHOB|nr:sugar kinase [Histidinibacterium lentulum]ROT97778.1 sugar kinase [Histidinibacterium lentulum]
MPRIVCIGEAMLELSEAPEPDLWRMGVAGDTLNTAWYLRELLAADWQVDYLTRLGTDPFSDRIARFIASSGIGTGHITRDPAHGPGLYAISLDKGERSFTYWRATSAARHLADDEDALDAALDGAALAYLSGITLAILAEDRRAALLQRIAAAGVPLAYDSNYRPRLWEDADTARAWGEDAARAAAYVLPSADDEAALFGDDTPDATAARYAAIGPETVVKTGGGPVALGTGETVTELPKVDPVDTTGAGDSFNAGYLAARLCGADPRDAVRRAHALASRVVQGKGALVPAGRQDAAGQ